MGDSWGNNIRYTIWGESHGAAIGIIVDGLPAGVQLDMDSIQFEIDRRKPGSNNISTSRKEKDSFRILSGFYNGFTTGSALAIIIENKDTKSEHYDLMKSLMRPGHADYTGYIKYKGFNDFRGGGHFSGRLTAPLVIAGAIAKQLLSSSDIAIGSHVHQIGDIKDIGFDMTNIQLQQLEKLRHMSIPVLISENADKMIQLIEQIKQDGDSIGGSIEIAVLNLPAGMGSPFFDSFESTLSHLIFSIPAVKGIEFGAGFSLATMKGSHANDEFFFHKDNVRTYTNNNGGILGGISNGMPVIFRVAIKPTPSIALLQRTIDIKSHTDSQIHINGRHDPCIVPRAVPVIEAVTAIAILDMFYEGRKHNLWD